MCSFRHKSNMHCVQSPFQHWMLEVILFTTLCFNEMVHFSCVYSISRVFSNENFILHLCCRINFPKGFQLNPKMADRKAELEKKRIKLQAMREEKERRRKEKELKDVRNNQISHSIVALFLLHLTIC